MGAAMSISAKPVSPSINTGATHYPDHLWLLDEGSGTNLDDKGGGTAADMTIVGSDVVWESDATHGWILKANAGNTTSYAHVNTNVGASSAICVAFIARVGATPATGRIYLGGLGRQSTTAVYACSSITGNTGIHAVIYDDPTNPSQLDGYGTADWTDAADHLFVVKFQANGGEHSIDGAALQAVGSPTFDYSGASFDRFGIFARLGTAIVGPCPGDSTDPTRIIAVAAWVNDYATWDDTWMSGLYNSGDPWPALGVEAVTTQAFQYQSRLNPLLRM